MHSDGEAAHGAALDLAESRIQRLHGIQHAALMVALRYGQIDGEHHARWVIDQMVRRLTGEGYDEWVAAYEEGGAYTWDTGIAP